MPSPSPYNRILVATDFSPHAEAAVRQAAWVARRSGCQLTVAHVLPDIQASIAAVSYELLQGEFSTEDPEKFEQKRRKEALRQLKQSVTSYRALRGRIQFETWMGTPFVKIIHAVQREEHELVLVGTRGLSTLKNFLLGSTAGRLIRKCPCDVWVVKRAEDRPLQSLVVPVDYSEVSSRALQRGAWLTREAGAELHVLHVVDSADVPADLLERAREDTPRLTMRGRIQLAAKEHMNAFLRKHMPTGQAQSVATHISWGTPWKEIVRVSRRLSADAVVMGTVGRSGIAGMLLGNTAEKVLSGCDCSVLTVKPEGFVSPIAPPADLPAGIDA